MNSFSNLAPLRLKRREEGRMKAGHLWVFSNEVDVSATPLDSFESGQPVAIEASNGKCLGTGYVNPHSLIAARLLSRDPRHPISASLLVHRLNVALNLRQRLWFVGLRPGVGFVGRIPGDVLHQRLELFRRARKRRHKRLGPLQLGDIHPFLGRRPASR